MNLRLAIAGIALMLLACSCRGADQPPVVATQNDRLLQHHEIRMDQWPAPFATAR